MLYWKAKVYKTKRWEQLRAFVIGRDRNICRRCNRLIVGRADVHHIIDLTVDNYTNDAIAFNPDNLLTLHQECHNDIHKRFGKRTIVSDDLEIDYEKR